MVAQKHTRKEVGLENAPPEKVRAQRHTQKKKCEGLKTHSKKERGRVRKRTT